jgi:hypothetical protein
VHGTGAGLANNGLWQGHVAGLFKANWPTDETNLQNALKAAESIAFHIAHVIPDILAADPTNLAATPSLGPTVDSPNSAPSHAGG